MKIHQLPQGARFEYEGVVYVKTGPLFAAGPEGVRLIPKYALLKPLDGAAPTTVTSAPAGLNTSAVRAAFDTFYERCETLVPAHQRDALAAARSEFLNVLS